MPLPELNSLVTWAGSTYRVVGIFTDPALVLEAADGSTVTVGAAMTQARLMPELPVELYTVVRVTWADANPPSDVLTLVPGKRSGVVAWEGLSGAWGAQALAEEITGHEILARPV